MSTAGTCFAGPRLAWGARIAVIAPASRVDGEVLGRGLARLRSWGFQPVLGSHVLDGHGDLAGRDEARAADLEWALGEAGIDAVWAARGGWGTARTLAALPEVRLDRARRWVLGSSDVTVLLNALAMRGVCALHAPMVVDLADPSRFVARGLRAFLAAPRAPLEVCAGSASSSTLVRGKASGWLAGGNLTTLAAAIGTPFAPKFSGAIVILEDINEAPYRVDRLLWQLRQSGALAAVHGLVFGQFTRCVPAPGRASRSLRDVIRAHASALGVPAAMGFPVGHGRKTHAVPLGYSALLDASRGILRLRAPRAAP